MGKFASVLRLFGALYIRIISWVILISYDRFDGRVSYFKSKEKTLIIMMWGAFMSHNGISLDMDAQR